MKKYYACFLINENKKLIFESWDECRAEIKGKNHKIKSFKTKQEAEEWSIYKDYENKIHPDGIYFDSGTGRGKGVEVRVVDNNGKSLLDKIIESKLINENNNFYVKDFDGVSNNFGELLALYIALKIALKEDIKNIFGDSKLVLDYWSKGFYNKKLPDKTIKLIKKVTELRKIYEEKNGIVSFISGDDNPADLGFHKK